MIFKKSKNIRWSRTEFDPSLHVFFVLISGHQNSNFYFWLISGTWSRFNPEIWTPSSWMIALQSPIYQYLLPKIFYWGWYSFCSIGLNYHSADRNDFLFAIWTWTAKLTGFEIGFNRKTALGSGDDAGAVNFLELKVILDAILAKLDIGAQMPQVGPNGEVKPATDKYHERLQQLERIVEGTGSKLK